MLQVFLNHLFRHLSRGDTKVTACPKVSAPVALAQLRERLKQFGRGPSLDPPHDFAWSHIGRRGNQDMDVILAHHTLENLDLEGFAGLTDECPSLEGTRLPTNHNLL